MLSEVTQTQREGVVFLFVLDTGKHGGRNFIYFKWKNLSCEQGVGLGNLENAHFFLPESSKKPGLELRLLYLIYHLRGSC